MPSTPEDGDSQFAILHPHTSFDEILVMPLEPSAPPQIVMEHVGAEGGLRACNNAPYSADASTSEHLLDGRMAMNM
jgi:hypothetical protein